MDWILFFVIAVILIAVFVISQAVVIFVLLKENQRIGEELEKNSPPF
jgi:Na+-transporting NADH:ubiquinone oxidoreductase subunit NqrC